MAKRFLEDRDGRASSAVAGHATTADVPDEPLPPHPAGNWGRYLTLWGAATSVFGGIQLGTGGSKWAGAIMLLGGAMVWAGVSTTRNVRTVLLNNLALERLGRGKIDEAERLLARMPASAERHGVYGRAVFLRRATIALHRGDAQGAVVGATRAIELPRGMFQRRAQDMYIAEAHALRALAHSAIGNAAEARADADHAEGAPQATPVTFAHAWLARARLLARENDAAERTALFARAPQAMESLSPRERALARALRRMVYAAPRSVYREPAKPEDSSALGGIATWVAQVAPDAAPYVTDTEPHAHTAAVAPVDATTPEAKAAIAVERAQSGVGRGLKKRGLVLWAVLVVMFLGIWQFLSPSTSTPVTPIGANGKPATQVRAHPPPPAETKKDEPQDLSLYFILLAVGGVAFAVFRLRAVRTERRWRVAIQDMARGNDARASEELTHLTKSRLPMFASLAHLALAGLAERRADWDACLSHCEKGLAGIGTNRRLYSDYLLPELIATRALALAATSRAAEAEAQRALLQSQFPAFARAGGAHFRVQLMSAIRASDFDAAAAIARGRTLDLPLPLRDDVLADVVLAASAGATVDEVDRIARELREDEPLRAWIDAVAPGLRNRMHIREAGNATR